jgi:hypothetical protein
VPLKWIKDNKTHRLRCNACIYNFYQNLPKVSKGVLVCRCQRFGEEKKHYWLLCPQDGDSFISLRRWYLPPSPNDLPTQKITEHRGREVNIPASYLGGPAPPKSTPRSPCRGGGGGNRALVHRSQGVWGIVPKAAWHWGGHSSVTKDPFRARGSTLPPSWGSVGGD